MKQIINILATLIRNVKILGKNLPVRNEQSTELSLNNVHGFEVRERRRAQTEERRLRDLPDPELEDNLRGKYGHSKWATRLIKEILFSRLERRKISGKSAKDHN